ncbi:MAG: zinc-binding dehydrogenase [Chitinivibrionales bacterium]|nr:zinc-binding dehydrogenase [Chitinivibrionales bacterium]MBD3356671.1 zinc-binding dehydrogenase [Chitinivibrionales bacterium]
MRAAVIAAPQKAKSVELPIPQPETGQVRVKITGCGMCGSNLALWEGQPWFKYPLAPGAPGHEAWGCVEAAGSGVSEVRPGDMVAFMSNNAFAEYDIADVSALVPLPPTLRNKPFPGEPLACAMNVFARSGIQPGETVAIVGIGFLGALLTQLAASMGALVVAVSRRPYALEMAERFGARHTIVMEDHDAVMHKIHLLTDGHGCERVIEAIGAQLPLDLASSIVRMRGRLVIAGYHQDGPRQVNMQQWNWRGIDVVNAHERSSRIYVNGMRKAMRAIADGVLNPYPLYTHTFGLHEIGDAFEMMKKRPEGFMKGLVIP